MVCPRGENMKRHPRDFVVEFFQERQCLIVKLLIDLVNDDSRINPKQQHVLADVVEMLRSTFPNFDFIDMTNRSVVLGAVLPIATWLNTCH